MSVIKYYCENLAWHLITNNNIDDNDKLKLLKEINKAFLKEYNENKNFKDRIDTQFNGMFQQIETLLDSNDFSEIDTILLRKLKGFKDIYNFNQLKFDDVSNPYKLYGKLHFKQLGHLRPPSI
jgi:hypothetical protein